MNIKNEINTIKSKNDIEALTEEIYKNKYSEAALRTIVNQYYKKNPEDLTSSTGIINPNIIPIIEAYLQQKEIDRQKKDNEKSINIAMWAAIFSAISAIGPLIVKIAHYIRNLF